jgi:predicted dehydrogenase
MQSAAAGLLGLAGVRAWAQGRPAVPSERVTIASIGVGGMGLTDLSNLLPLPDVQVVAVCDVDRKHAESTRDIVNGIYAEAMEAGDYAGCATYSDFREVLARDDVDAVVIATPDHWHAHIAVAAMAAGKDVYCEKPLALTIAEGRKIVEAAERYGRVFQLGTQNRSHPLVRHICELVRNGRIGEVKRAFVGAPPGAYIPVQPVMPVPEHLDYDLWLGPAPYEPYTEKRTHMWFRSILDYSGGGITDLGTHYFDVMQWACGTDRTGPVELEGWGTFFDDGLSDVANAYDFHLRYANGLEVHSATGEFMGVRWEGSDGWIELPLRHPYPATPSASDPRILDMEIGANEERLYLSDNHWATFVRCVKTREETAAPAEVGHRSTSLPHLGNILFKAGGPLRWDPDRERFDNDDANRLLSRATRAPWQLA